MCKRGGICEIAFGKNTECSLPPREEATYFIDKYGQCEEKTARFYSDFLGKIAKKQTKRILMHMVLLRFFGKDREKADKAYFDAYIS